MSKLLCVLLLLACAPAPEDPAPDQPVEAIRQPLLSYATPYGGSYNRIGIGRISASNYSLIIYQRVSDNNCTLQALATPLWDDVTVDARLANGTEIQALGSGQYMTFYCANLGGSFTLDRTLQQAGHTLTVYGANYAADYMNCSSDGSGKVACFAGGGNDVMDTFWGGNVELWGGDGDDKIRPQGGNTALTKVFGGNGNDCLQWTGMGTLGAYDCVAKPGTCTDPIGHPENCDRSTYILGSHCEWLVPFGSCN
jgi:hypothetical protein